VAGGLLVACSSAAAVPSVNVAPDGPATAARLQGTVAVITPTRPDPALASDGCPPGQTPGFAYGFAELKMYLRDAMGDAVSCERYGPEGDALQQTTTGLARYRRGTNVPTFISGQKHWALTDRGLVYWTTAGLDPPADATVLGQPLVEPTALTETTAAEAATVTNTPRAVAGDPRWLEQAIELLREYDRKHGTVLVTALEKTRLVVARLPGAWAAYIPRLNTITLDPVLQTESPEAVATVLGHEAMHASDQRLYGGANTEVACYSYEIAAFRLQALLWQSFHGSGGKVDPDTELEDELNETLRRARSDAGGLIKSIHNRYADQCG
jgi:hypothetical protein